MTALPLSKRAYYARNKEAVAAYQRAYYARNKEALAARNKLRRVFA